MRTIKFSTRKWTVTLSAGKPAPKHPATCTECHITGMHLMSCSKWTKNN
jgi:hypothetical protein